MSADPKSLATLAIATANAKKNLAEAAANPTESSGAGVLTDGELRERPTIACINDPQKTVKFRSSDEFVAGLTAALINTTAMFPINKLIFRQMASGQRATTAAGHMREDGFRYLYRGILPPLIQKMVSVSIMFGSFGHYKKWADHKFASAPPIANLALASVLTGTTEAVLTPLERVQMLLQDRKYHKNYKNTIDALIKLRQFGTPEYYRGLTCVLMRNGPSNILFFGLRDEIKKFIPGYYQACENKRNATTNKGDNTTTQSIDSSNKLHFNSLPSGQTTIHLSPQKIMLYDFLSGAILGMFISTLFYPLSVVRTRMQTRAPGTEFLSIVKAFNQVYEERDRRFTKFFRGCLINVLRQFVSWGVINCSYEFVLTQLHSIK